MTSNIATVKLPIFECSRAVYPLFPFCIAEGKGNSVSKFVTIYSYILDHYKLTDRFYGIKSHF